MGGRNCTSAVDLYSFGVLLWEVSHPSPCPSNTAAAAALHAHARPATRCPLTCGATPFPYRRVRRQIFTGLRPVRAHMPSPSVPGDCTQEAADLMAACCSLDPAARPSAEAVMKRLHAMLAAQHRGRPLDFS